MVKRPAFIFDPVQITGRLRHGPIHAMTPAPGLLGGIEGRIDIRRSSGRG